MFQAVRTLTREGRQEFHASLSGKAVPAKVWDRYSVRAFTGQNDANRFKQHKRIQHERMILDVVKIVLQFLDGIIDGGAILVANLSPARYPRFYAVPHCVKGNASC